MESAEFWAAHAALLWQIEAGADEAIGDVPVDRFALVPEPPKQPKHPAPVAARPAPPAAPQSDPVAEAKQAAQAAGSLEALRAAMEAFEGCALKQGARSFVFSDGVPGARVMIIGEAPGREEDRAGRPFVGRAGQLLDRMLAEIGLGRSGAGAGVYITNVLPWRPPQNRAPKPDEIAMMRPFLERHVALAAPEVLVVMGNVSCQGVWGEQGITRLRGQWRTAFDRPVLPMFHPAYLLRTPRAKREAWSDLLSLKAKLLERD